MPKTKLHPQTDDSNGNESAIEKIQENLKQMEENTITISTSESENELPLPQKLQHLISLLIEVYPISPEQCLIMLASSVLDSSNQQAKTYRLLASAQANDRLAKIEAEMQFKRSRELAELEAIASLTSGMV